MRSRQLLLGMIIGIVLSAASWVTAKIVSRDDASKVMYVVSYIRAGGPFPNREFEGVTDPGAGLMQSEYLTRLALECGVEAFQIDEMDVTDVRPSAHLLTASDAVDESALECLSDRRIYPYIEISVAENCPTSNKDRQFIGLPFGIHKPHPEFCIKSHRPKEA